MDQTEAHISRLSSFLRPTAVELINACRDAGLPMVITSSRRTQQEQASLVRQGRSLTMQSKHLIGQAFDIDVYGMNRDAVPAWVWDEIGPYAESLGLRWGGRWATFRDVAHFEA